MPTTTDPAEKLDAVAQAIAATVSAHIPGLDVLDHEDPRMDRPTPFFTVGGCEVDWADPGEPDVNLRADGWDQDWSLTVVVKLNEHAPAASWSELRSLIGQIRDAVAFDPDLSGEARYAAITSAATGPGENVEGLPRVLVGELTLSCFSPMSSPT